MPTMETSRCRRPIHRMKPIPNAEECYQAIINGSNFFLPEFPEHSSDPTLIDRAQMIDQREGLLGKPTLARRQRWVQQPFARSSCDRHHAHKRKPLVADDFWIAHDNARSHTMLFVTEGRVEFHYDNHATAEFHSCPSTQPSPEIH